MNNREFLTNLMQRYTTDHLVNVAPDEFERHIKSLPGQRDELVKEAEYQRTKSVVFEWGHNHDFGTFKMDGAMGDRHIDVLAWAMDEFGVPERDLSGKDVLDVGCWTGGASLLLAEMGASVFAIDEVPCYTRALYYMSQAFMTSIEVFPYSIYDVNSFGPHDLICMFGVLYHVSDPVVALRIAFNCLKDGGSLLLESAVLPSSVSSYSLMYCEYRGPSSHTPWNWFVPSVGVTEQMCRDVGFRVVDVRVRERRALLHCIREKYKPMMRAGLSRSDV